MDNHFKQQMKASQNDILNLLKSVDELRASTNEQTDIREHDSRLIEQLTHLEFAVYSHALLYGWYDKEEDEEDLYEVTSDE